MHDSSPSPLPDRIRAAISTLAENYSKSGAQVALGLLREVLPLAEGRDAVDVPELQVELADESGLAEPHFRWKTTIRTQLGQDAGAGTTRVAAADLVFGAVEKVMKLRVHARLVRRGIELYSCKEPTPEQLQQLEELAAEYARAVGAMYTPPSTEPVEVGGRVSVERVRFNQGVKPDLLPRFAAVAHALEMGNPQVALMPIDEEKEIYGDETVVETAVKLIREFLDGADDQIEVVNSKFKDVFWLGGNLTGFRFEHLPDVVIPDDNAQAMLHQYMVKSATPPNEVFAVAREAQVGNLPAMVAPGRLFLTFGPPQDRMGQRVAVHAYYLADGKLWVVDRGDLDLHNLLVMQQDIRLEVHLQHPAEPSTVNWPSSGTIELRPSLPVTVAEAVPGQSDLPNANTLSADEFAAFQTEHGVMPTRDPGQERREALGDTAPRVYTLPGSTRSLIRGEAGEGCVSITTDEAGAISQVTVHDVGDEDEFEDEANVGPVENEDGLAARCDVMADNLSTLLGPMGDENPVPEPLRSGVVTAAVLLGEVATYLREQEKEWWVIEDMSAGTDADATLYALPKDGLPGLDDAIEKWAHTLERIHAADEHRDPREEPFDVRIDTMAFRPERVAAGLGEHPGTLYFVQVPGAVKLMEAIGLLTEGESLYIDDGSITTTYASSDSCEPQDVFKLLDYCDTPEDGRSREWMRGEEELAHDEAEEAFQAQRHDENLRDHDDFLRRTTPPDGPRNLAAAYVQQGWMLHQDGNGIAHLLDAEVGTTAADHGGDMKGQAVEPATVHDENLCGRCCAAANDRAAQTAADAAG